MNAGLHYRETAAAGADPVHLVILLYQQAIEDLRRALAANAKGDVEGRTREINHALLVIGHLEASLDKEQGGKVALDLERFYTQVRCGLSEAQCRQSARGIEQQISCLVHVYEAWCDVEKSLTQSAPSPQERTAKPGSPGWNA